MQCTSDGGAPASFALPRATDNCPNVGTPVCSPASGAVFQVGSNTVTCTVSDAAGNSNSCTTTVTVVDTKPPVITGITANPSVLVPNGQTDGVTITPTVKDPCEPNPPVCSVTGITGGTEPPFSGALTISIVGQPIGPFPRTLTVAVKCVNAVNRTATGTVQITVSSPIAQAVENLISKIEQVL